MKNKQNNMQDFSWTDETVLELIKQRFVYITEERIAEHIESFKSSKTAKDWEVVAYRVRKDKIFYTEYKDPRFERIYANPERSGGHFWLEDVNHPEVEIWAIRRLSDQSVWSVGDKAGTPAIPAGRSIKSFEIMGEGIVADFGDGRAGINLLEKLPAPVLVTADGVEVAEGNRIYPVDNNFGFVVTTLTKYNKDGWLHHKVFSTREAAETYVLENKPCLSIRDLRELIGSIIFDKPSTGIYIIDKATEFINNKNK